MDIEIFLRSELESIIKEDISPEEQKMLDLKQMEYFIYQRLTSKKFRKKLLKPETLAIIKSKIALSVKANKPIYLIFAFDGYKNHWVTEFHPKAEWAEFFHLLYITKPLTPIAKAYGPGVFHEYESECEAGIYHNNQSKADVDAYTESFKALIEYIKPFVPKNLTFNYRTLPEQYDTKPFFERVLGMVDAKTEELREQHKDDRAEALKRSLFNLKLHGKEDLTHKTKDELNEIALRSLAFNHLFLDEDYKNRKDYFNGDERISTVGAYCSEEENPDNWMTINACARSANAYWTSRGILVTDQDGFKENIVGPKAYSELKPKMVDVKLFDGVLAYLNRIPVVE